MKWTIITPTPTILSHWNTLWISTKAIKAQVLTSLSSVKRMRRIMATTTMTLELLRTSKQKQQQIHSLGSWRINRNRWKANPHVNQHDRRAKLLYNHPHHHQRRLQLHLPPRRVLAATRMHWRNWRTSQKTWRQWSGEGWKVGYCNLQRTLCKLRNGLLDRLCNFLINLSTTRETPPDDMFTLLICNKLKRVSKELRPDLEVDILKAINDTLKQSK